MITFCAGVMAGVVIMVAVLGLYIFGPRPREWEWW